jgi:hypothetical protein
MMSVGEKPLHVAHEHTRLGGDGKRGTTRGAGPGSPSRLTPGPDCNQETALVSITLESLPAVISTLRGFACSATGMVTVSTPLSYAAST